MSEARKSLYDLKIDGNEDDELNEDDVGTLVESLMTQVKKYSETPEKIHIDVVFYVHLVCFYHSLCFWLPI